MISYDDNDNDDNKFISEGDDKDIDDDEAC